MDGIFYGYDVSAATWFYHSLLLIAAVFFKFNRVWSLRNLDLLLLLLISPGLILVEELPRLGYVWLFVITTLLLVRLFCDSLLQRRPRLEQNLNMPGMAFLGISAFGFLMIKVVTEPPPASTVETVRRGQQLLALQDAASGAVDDVRSGPATSLFAAPVLPLSSAVASGNGTSPTQEWTTIELLSARMMAVLAHFAVIAGLVFVGRRHFGDLQLGLAMATLYLLLPCTAFDVHKVNHVLPAALIVWAFAAYRRPMVAGSLMGLACGTLFFPVFLLPLWMTFYDRRGALRFAAALGIVGAVLLGSLVLTSADTHSFTQKTIGSIDWSVLEFRGGTGIGFWSMYDSAYRIPVFAAFLVLLTILTIWPRTKTLEHLMAHSTAIVVGTQFWYPQQGGVYLLWYLPLLLLVVFRPRLTHLVPPALKLSTTADDRELPRHARRELAGSRTPHSHLFR